MARRRPRVLPFVVGIGIGAAALRRLARVRGTAVGETAPRPDPRAPAPAAAAVAVQAADPMSRRRRWPVVAIAVGAVAVAASAGVGTAVVIEDDAAPSPPPLTVPPVDVPLEGLTADRVVKENERDGTSAWRLDPKRAKGIEGFADAASAVRGEAVSVYVSTVAESFRVEAYRLGYYDGDGARLVWESDDIDGVRQPPALVEPRTRMVEADWQPSLTVRITADFIPGMYVLKLVGAGDEQAHVPLVVRDDASRAAFLVLDPTTSRHVDRMGRAFSFDRVVGAADVVRDALPFIALVESLGLDVSYWSDVDLHRRAAEVRRHRAVVVMGSDAYWSSTMREALVSARDGGVNIVFLRGGDPPHRVRLEDSPLGLDRRIVDDGLATPPPPLLAGPRVARLDERATAQQVVERLRVFGSAP